MDCTDVSFFQFVWEVTVVYTYIYALVKYGQITSFASRIIAVCILPLLALLLSTPCILLVVLNRSPLLNSNCLYTLTLFSMVVIVIISIITQRIHHVKINFIQVCLQNPTNYITTMAIKLLSIYDPEEYTSDPRITKHATLGLLFPKMH